MRKGHRGGKRGGVVLHKRIGLLLGYHARGYAKLISAKRVAQPLRGLRANLGKGAGEWRPGLLGTVGGVYNTRLKRFNLGAASKMSVAGVASSKVSAGATSTNGIAASSGSGSFLDDYVARLRGQNYQ